MTERKFPAVSAESIKGKILIVVIRMLCRIIAPFLGAAKYYPKPDFEENSLYFKRKDLLYFAYKYYLNPHEKSDEQDKTSLYFKKNPIQIIAKAKSNTQHLTLSLGGDLMPYEMINHNNCKALWDYTGDWFFGSDLVFANLETPLHNNKKPSLVPEVMLSNMLFNATVEQFEIFSGNGKFKGYDILSTANNHSFDMGMEGVEETIAFLKRQNMLHAGTSINPEEQFDIPCIEKNGIKVAFVAATYCVNHVNIPDDYRFSVNVGRFNQTNCDLSLLEKLCASARKKNPDLLVLSLHTGNAYQAYPSAHTTEIMHRIAKTCEPDIIVGGHPHNPQQMEEYKFISNRDASNKKTFIIYSLGDFVAYDIFTWCHLHLMTKIHIQKEQEQVIISMVEVLPHHMVKNTNGLQFVPISKLSQGNAIFDTLSKTEQAKASENLRFWNRHLKPSLGASLVELD